jgi:sec-independent protein translocase protein TatB
MFDMGITEMMLIGIVALVVIGPERLPGVARTAGKYFSKLRSFMTDVRADVESELKADELREILAQQKKELNSLKDVVNEAGKDLNLSEGLGVAEIKKSIEDAMPDLNSGLEFEPIAETKPPAKSAAKSSVRKKASSKKKAVVSGKKTIKKKTTKVKMAAKSTPAKAKSGSKTKTKTKTTAAVKKSPVSKRKKASVKPGKKAKKVAKPQPKADSNWTNSITSPDDTIE